MDAAQILQTVLSVIQSGAADVAPSSVSPSATTAPLPSETVSRSTIEPAALSLPQILLLLLSTTAFRDWLKLLLIGAVLETGRRSLKKGWEKVVDYFWVTAAFDWDEDATDWLMYWLQQRKVFQSARSIEVSTHFFGLDNTRSDDLGETEDGEQQVAFIPSLSRTYYCWYKGRYMTVTRDRLNDGTFRYRPKDMLELRMLTRNSALIRELLIEARKEYKTASEHLINVYVADSDHWKRVATQEKRPMSSVILDPGVLELVLEDARDFLNSKQWYADRGIPFRRGYLLYGAPGAGKTSMIHGIAGALGLDIYILSLTVMSLDDNSLKSIISHLPKSCIVLIEDIDAAFTRGMKRDIADPEAQGAGARPSGTPSHPAEGDRTKEMMFNGVTLSGLLNALDGIAAQEGRILFATTNDYSALDPALLRPGRLDLHIEFHLASRYQARELFCRFYSISRSSDGPSVDDDELDEKNPDSGYSFRASSAGVDSKVEHKTEPDGAGAPPSYPEGVSTVYGGMSHTARSLRLSPKKAAELAEVFAEIIPAKAFSMATLQGYLMAYKVRPYVAIEEAPAWVEKKLREKAMKGMELDSADTSNTS